MQTKHLASLWIFTLALFTLGISSASALPNLVPQSISLGASSVVAGGTLTVNWTLANTGNSSSPSTVTGVRLNQSSTSFTATYTSYPNVSMPALSASSSTPQSTTITVPAGTAPGTYYIWIIADNVSSGAITQSNYADDEQHSVAFTVTAPVQLPNLVPQSISLGASSVVAGGTLTVNWTLANTGSGSSPSTVTGVRLNQSSSSFTATYTSYPNVSMPALAANSSTPQSTTITVPAGTAPGAYYIWIIADNVSSGAITQSNYGDDEQHSVAFTVTAPVQLPNLVPQNISLGASSVVAGGTLAVNWTLANTGSGSSPSTVTGVRLNQSSTSFTATYTSYPNVSMSALAANSSTPQSTTITVPAGTAPGTYYIWIIADNVSSGAITQSNYGDDEQPSAAFTVTAPQLPNLVPQSINLSSTSLAPSATLTVNWTLANTDNGSSPSTVTGVRINQSTSSFAGTTITNVMMPALNGNSSTAQSAQLIVPATPGTYYVWIIADNVTSGAITQSNYGDDEQHSVAFTVTAPVQLPNLVPQNINLSSTSPAPGSILTVNWTLANIDSGSSPSTVTGVRINQSSSSFSGTTITNVVMPALTGNSSTPQSAQLIAPTIAGTYYVWIIADNVTSGAITQSNYGDDEQHSAAFTVTNSTTTSNRALGVDVYHGRGNINWTSVAASQETFAIIKAIDGYRTSQALPMITDANFSTYAPAAKQAGLIVGAYDFARPYINTAKDEADFFISVAGNYIGPGYLPPALDIEDPDDELPNHPVSALGKTVLSQWIRDWCAEIVAVKHVKPMIYTTPSFTRTLMDSDLAQYPLWIAYYESLPDVNPQTDGAAAFGSWNYSWTFLQYSVQGHTLDGAVQNPPEDLNVFNGNLAALNAYVTGSSGDGSAPNISNAQLSGTTFTLSVPTQVGTNYILEFKNLLSDANWTPIQTNSGNGGMMNLTNTGTVGPSRFYHIRIQ